MRVAISVLVSFLAKMVPLSCKNWLKLALNCSSIARRMQVVLRRIRLLRITVHSRSKIILEEMSTRTVNPRMMTSLNENARRLFTDINSKIKFNLFNSF